MTTRSLRTLRPTTGWVSLDLHELGEFRDLLLEFARRDIKLRYRQTVLGIAWVVLQPLVAAGVLNFAFGIVAGARPPGGSYFLFTFAGSAGVESLQLDAEQDEPLAGGQLVPHQQGVLSAAHSAALRNAVDAARFCRGARRSTSRCWRSTDCRPRPLLLLLPVWIGLICLPRARRRVHRGGAHGELPRHSAHPADPDSVHALREPGGVRRDADTRPVSDGSSIS